MSCNSCAKSFSILRKEKGCPGCGFSYCSKCLENKVFLEKLNREAKVCAKCKRSADSGTTAEVQPPDAYYKRIGAMDTSATSQIDRDAKNTDGKDQEIQQRLQKLKDGNKASTSNISDKEIVERLKKIKGEMPTATDTEIQERLAKLKGISSVSLGTEKVKLPAADHRTEQEQVDDLMKQFLEKTNIDNKYKNEFDNVLSGIESRLLKLKAVDGNPVAPQQDDDTSEKSEDEEETMKKIIEKCKAEAMLENQEICPVTEDELPFCEICNNDAILRCLGCQYLFCTRCFHEHKDDDDGCNRYDLLSAYQPQK